MTSAIPRYWTGCGISSISLPTVAGPIGRRSIVPRIGGFGGPCRGPPSSSSPQNERAAGRRYRPAEIHRDLGVLHLAALARRVVVGVHALGGSWAVIVHGAAELAYVLDDHVHAVGVALAEVTTRGVVRALAAQPDDPAAHVVAPLALLAEAVLLELEHRGERERVVGTRDVHVLGRDPGLSEDDVLGVIAGHAADRAVGPVKVRARLADSPGHAHHVDGTGPEVAGTLGRRHDHAGGVVGLEAAVEQVQRLDDPA